MGSRTDLVRRYFDSKEDADALNEQLTAIDKEERPELYETEGSTWCAPQWDDDKGQWFVFVRSDE